MTELKCSVENCTHNCQHLCSLHEIEVSGKKADTSNNTCCSSFREQKDGATNSTSDQYAEPETFINCSAKECKHNGDCKCHADNVDICGCGAQHKEYTECHTFEPK